MNTQNQNLLAQTLAATPSMQRWSAMVGMVTMLSEDKSMPASMGSPLRLMLAIDVASNLNCSLALVLENLRFGARGAYWSTKGLISLVNMSGRYAGSLAYETNDKGEVRAFAVNKSDQTKLEGLWIGDSAFEESAPDYMFFKTTPVMAKHYRAASAFVALHCPEITGGILTLADEVGATSDAAAGVAVTAVTGTGVLAPSDLATPSALVIGKAEIGDLPQKGAISHAADPAFNQAPPAEKASVGKVEKAKRTRAAAPAATQGDADTVGKQSQLPPAGDVTASAAADPAASKADGDVASDLTAAASTPAAQPAAASVVAAGPSTANAVVNDLLSSLPTMSSGATSQDPAQQLMGVIDQREIQPELNTLATTLPLVEQFCALPDEARAKTAELVVEHITPHLRSLTSEDISSEVAPGYKLLMMLHASKDKFGASSSQLIEVFNAQVKRLRPAAQASA